MGTGSTLRRTVAAFALLSAIFAAGAFAYTAKITNAYASGPGFCAVIEICWYPGVETPPSGAMTATAWENDDGWDPDDPCGNASGPSPESPVHPGPNGMMCQDWLFCFPLIDCEMGEEEVSAQININGSIVGTPVYAGYIC